MSSPFDPYGHPEAPFAATRAAAAMLHDAIESQLDLLPAYRILRATAEAEGALDATFEREEREAMQRVDRAFEKGAVGRVWYVGEMALPLVAAVDRALAGGPRLA